MRKYFILIIVVIFVALSGAFYLLETMAPEFSFNALIGGNILMAILSLISYGIVQKQMSSRPAAFVGGVYGATFLKLMVCITAILIYALTNKANIHKPSLFMLFGIYIVYTSVETILLSKMAKETN